MYFLNELSVVDDLDRCSPDTTLEVFESIKAFLDIEGFVFIIGLSREALDKLITKKFEQMGLTGITGEEYIRKIIQIEINIQKWKDYAIKDLIGKLSTKLHDKTIEDNKDLIAKGIEMNPRQVKRLINRYVVVRSAYLSAKRQFNSKSFLIGEIFKDRWPEIYQHLSDETFLASLRNFIESQPNERSQFIQSLETKKAGKEEKLLDFEEVILSYKDNSALWDFIEFNKDDIKIGEPASSAKEWKRLQRASDSTSIPISSKQHETYGKLNYYYDQLRQGHRSASEFWEKEDGLRSILMYLSNNAFKYGATFSMRDEIRSLLNNIILEFAKLRDARDLGKEEQNRYEYEYRLIRLYGEAIDLIQKRLPPGLV